MPRVIEILDQHNQAIEIVYYILPFLNQNDCM